MRRYRPRSSQARLPLATSGGIHVAPNGDEAKEGSGPLHLLHPRISYGPALYSVLWREEEKRQ